WAPLGATAVQCYCLPWRIPPVAETSSEEIPVLFSTTSQENTPFTFLQESGQNPPANTFTVRRARFGFQGNYGDHWQYGILTDVASSSGATVRDVYLNFKYNPEFQVQGGQFKEPFAQEVVAGVTNLDFVERGL